MNKRAKNTTIGNAHVRWLADVLGVPFSGGIDIDILDEQIGVEVKSAWNRWSGKWTIHDYQRELFRKRHHGKSLYWAFIRYGLQTDVERLHELRAADYARIEQLVTHRDVWILPWTGVEKLELHHGVNGDAYRYMTESRLPSQENFRIYEQRDSRIFVPKRGGLILEQRITGTPF
ncbi:MAG: hypothetical protein ABIA93_00160 [Candidatus Woesearchaeota archaeon]